MSCYLRLTFSRIFTNITTGKSKQSEQWLDEFVSECTITAV